MSPRFTSAARNYVRSFELKIYEHCSELHQLQRCYNALGLVPVSFVFREGNRASENLLSEEHCFGC